MAGVSRESTDQAGWIEVVDRVEAERLASAVLVVGAAGIGKSTRLEAIAEECRNRQWHVVAVGITHAESMLMWAGLASARPRLADLGRTLAMDDPARLELLSRLTDVDAAVVAEGLAQLFIAAAADAPTLLVVDDAHWLDQASTAAISFAVRACAARPLLVAVGARPGPQAIDLVRVLGEERSTRIDPMPLTVVQTRRLLVDRFGVKPSQVDTERVHATTRGVPLFVVEIGRQLASGRSVDDALRLASIDAALEERLAGLPEGVQRVVEAAALLAEPSTSTLQRLEPGSADAVAEAERLGVLLIDGTRALFRHPLLQAAAEQRLGVLGRRALHERLAAIVDDADERVVHLAAAASAPDATLADELERVATGDDLRGATLAAARRFDRSIELTASAGPDLARRCVLAGEVYLALGDSDVARERLERALAGAPTDEVEARALFGLATVLCEAEGLSASLAVAEQAVHRFDSPSRERAAALAFLARTELFRDLRASERLTRDAVDAARASGDEQLRTEAAAAWGEVAILRGLPVDVEELRARAETFVRDRDRAIPGWLLAEALVWSDHHELAIEVCQTERHRRDACGHRVAAINATHLLASQHLRLGRWDEAERYLHEWASSITAAGGDASTAAFASDWVYLDAVRGRFAEARARAAPLRGAFDDIPLYRLRVNARLAFADFVAGEIEDAALAMVDVLRSADEIGYEGLTVLPFRADAVEALAASGRVDEALAQARRNVELASIGQQARAVADAQRSMAIAWSAAGELATAAEAADRANAAHATFAAPFEHARVLAVAGMIARRRGRRLEARSHLVAAQDAFERLGATPFAERVATELTRVSGRRREAERGLTATEQRVAAAVARGLTNRQVAAELYLSVKTVDFYLQSIYRKLGVRTRTEMSLRVMGESRS